MRRRHLLELGTSVAALVLASSPVRGDSIGDGLKGRAPYQMMRTLAAVQDQTGVGNIAAHKVQRSLIVRIGQELAKAPDEAWSEPRNARALVAYVLSGGLPDVLKRVVEKKIELKGIDPNLAVGAIAFAERMNSEARVFFMKINPRELEMPLASRVALVKGIIHQPLEPEEAIKNFELARLFAPGSLVEQGALRRQSIVESRLGRWHRAEKMARRYLRQFGGSVYAQTYYRELAEQLANEPDNRDEDQFNRLRKLFDLIPEGSRRKTYLFLAERAVLNGKVKMARFAAARASELYEDGSRERERIGVIQAAANVASERTGEGMEALKSVRRRRLGPQDNLLADAAVEVGTDVRWEPVFEESEVPEALQDPPPDETQASPLVSVARQSIENADKLRGDTKP